MKFFCDVMLGKLAKYLRVLGFDTRYENKIREEDLFLIARREGRKIITRKVKLKGMEDVIYLDIDSPKEQLRFLFEKLNLKEKMEPFSRCLVCNEELQKIKKEEAKGKVPYYTYQTQEKFSLCPSCQRIYWPGTHLRDMERLLKSLTS
ncbi:MAG: Mut7-C RNAse domain-containing protein [candidate division WOR-3 bacterium]